MVVLAQVALMVEATTLAVLVLTGAVRVWHLVALSIWSGVASGFDVPARQALIVRLVGGQDLPNAIALNSSIFNGAAMAQWYSSNGATGIAPTDPVLIKGFDLYREAATVKEDKRSEIAQEIWKLLVDQVWSIGLVGQSPAYMGTRVVNLELENVPGRTCTSQHCRTPWSGHPEQWFFK